MSREKRYNYLYKTTNIINDKFYIGIHSTNKLDDGYIGCGVRSLASAKGSKRYGIKSAFIDAVVKYGYDSFKIEILKYFDTKEGALKEEELIVTREFIERKDTYNVAIGGTFGAKYKTSVETDESIFKDFMAGMKKEEICIKYGISESIIFRITRCKDTSKRIQPLQDNTLAINKWIQDNKNFYIEKYKNWELSKNSISKITPFDFWKNDFIKKTVRHKKYKCETPEGDIIEFNSPDEISMLLGVKIFRSGLIPVIKGKYKQYKGFKFYNNLNTKENAK